MPEMLKQYTFTDLSSAETKALLKRPKMDFEAIFKKRSTRVIDRVAEQGDQAVIHWNTQFDGQCGSNCMFSSHRRRHT